MTRPPQNPEIASKRGLFCISDLMRATGLTRQTIERDMAIGKLTYAEVGRRLMFELHTDLVPWLGYDREGRSRAMSLFGPAPPARHRSPYPGSARHARSILSILPIHVRSFRSCSRSVRSA